MNYIALSCLAMIRRSI